MTHRGWWTLSQNYRFWGKGWLTELMSDKGVCRTALATSGRLNMEHSNINIFSNKHWPKNMGKPNILMSRQSQSPSWTEEEKILNQAKLGNPSSFWARAQLSSAIPCNFEPDPTPAQIFSFLLSQEPKTCQFSLHFLAQARSG